MAPLAPASVKGKEHSDTHSHRSTKPLFLGMNEWLVILIIVLTFTLPARLVFPPLGAAGVPALIVSLGLALAWMLSFIHSSRQWATPLRWILALFMITVLIGYTAGALRGLPLIETASADRLLLKLIALTGLALVVSEGIRDYRTLRIILITVAGFGALQSVLGFGQAMFDLDIREFIVVPGLQSNTDLLGNTTRGEANVARVAGTMTHYIEFGVVLAMMAPIAIHNALYARTTHGRSMAWISAALITSGVALGVSRSGIVALAISIGFLAIVWSNWARLKLAIVAVAGALVFSAVLPGVLGTLRELFLGAENDPSVQGRTEDYAIVSLYFEARPLLGRGLGTFMPERYILLDNQYLMTVLGTGLVGLAGLLTLLIGAYLMARSIRRRAVLDEHRHLGQVLAGSITAGAVASALFDSFSFATFVLTLFLLIGLVGALWRLANRNLTDPAVTRVTPPSYVQPPLLPDLPDPTGPGSADPSPVPRDGSETATS